MAKKSAAKKAKKAVEMKVFVRVGMENSYGDTMTVAYSSKPELATVEHPDEGTITLPLSSSKAKELGRTESYYLDDLGLELDDGLYEVTIKEVK